MTVIPLASTCGGLIEGADLHKVAWPSYLEHFDWPWSESQRSTMTSEMVVKSIQWYSHRSRSTMNTSPRVWNSTHVIE